MFFVSALAALALAAAPEAVAAEKAAPAATPTLDAKAQVKTKKVCTETPALSGTRMPKRSCRTVKVEDKAPPAAGVKADAGDGPAN